MRDNKLANELPGTTDPLRLVPSRRGSWIGGPGFIFALLLLLIGAGGVLYLQSTGELEQLVFGGDRVSLGSVPGATGTGADANGAPELQPMTPLSGAATSAPAPVKQLVLTAMGPEELLTARPAPRSLRLVPGEFDQPPVIRYARPALFIGTGPRIAIVIINLGLNQGVTAAAIADLPPEITLSFSPYAPDLAAWIEAAHAYGHEAMLDLPLEPRNYPQDDPGPLGLLTALNAEENLRRLDQLLESADGITGVATQFGDRFLGDGASLRPILSEIGQRGLGFIATTGKASALAEASRGLADAPLRRAVDIDLAQDQSHQALATQLDALMTLARDRQQALAVVQPYPLSIAALTTLVPAAKGRGLALVPASALLAKD